LDLKFAAVRTPAAQRKASLASPGQRADEAPR